MLYAKQLRAGIVSGLLALALLALPAAAQAATVTLHEGSSGGTILSTGAAIKGFSSNLTFSVALGQAIECAENEVNGEVLASPGEPAEVEITSGRFEATGHGGACITSITGVARADITAVIPPSWIVQFASTGTSTILNAGFKATLTSSEGADLGTCIYAGSPLADSFNFNSALIDTITGQTMTKQAGSSANCPMSGTLNGTFAITHGTSVVVATTP